MIRAWTYEEVCQLYNELATINHEDTIRMWQERERKHILCLRLVSYTPLDIGIIHANSLYYSISEQYGEAVVEMWAKEEESERDT